MNCIYEYDAFKCTMIMLLLLKNDLTAFLPIFFSDLWVSGVTCPLLSCGLHKRYTSSASSSYIANGTSFNIRYGSGPVSGFQSVDDLNIGGLIVKNQEFAEVTDAKGLGLGYLIGKFDGILGLAFPQLSVNKVPTPFSNIISQKLDKNAVFAFYLGSLLMHREFTSLGTCKFNDNNKSQ
jgi:hypothetical protein